MSKVIGKLLTCDRCGESVFLPWTGGGVEWSRDKDDSNFQKAPEGWGYGAHYSAHSDGRYSVRDLCPVCFKIYLKGNSDYWAGFDKEK